MIEAIQLAKSFGAKRAVNNMNFKIQKGAIYGLVGSNGAGKSTLLRLIAGIYRPGSGRIQINGAPIYDNPDNKKEIFFVSDNPFFYKNFTLRQMMDFYSHIYENWSEEIFMKLHAVFNLPLENPVHTFSKGMQRQAALILGLATRPAWLLLDEAFDGLDPIMRQALRKCIIEEITEHEQTVIISTHNLRELEDICDHVIIMHEGNQIMACEMDELRQDMYKVEVVFSPDNRPHSFNLDIVSSTAKSNFNHYIVKGDKNSIEAELLKYNPIILEILPLTFEEIFLYELSTLGYDLKTIFQ